MAGKLVHSALAFLLGPDCGGGGGEAGKEMAGREEGECWLSLASHPTHATKGHFHLNSGTKQARRGSGGRSREDPGLHGLHVLWPVIRFASPEGEAQLHCGPTGLALDLMLDSLHSTAGKVSLGLVSGVRWQWAVWLSGTNVTPGFVILNKCQQHT